MVASLFEKAHEPQWVARLAMAVLFADIVLVWRTGTGIRHWAFDGAAILRHAGMLIVDMLMLGILSAFILPMANALMQRLVFDLHLLAPSWLRGDHGTRRPPYGCVHSIHFHKHALLTKDPLLWGIWKDHEAQRRAPSPLTATKLLFSLLVLALADLLLPMFGAQGSTLLLDALGMLGESGWLIYGSVLVVVLWRLCGMWIPASELDFVYYPPLYDEVEDRRRAHP